MKRQTVYPGAIPLETDILNTNRDTMIGLAKLASAILGTSTVANGLVCTATSPASLQVDVAAGEIYSMQAIDSTAYSSLAADTAHTILKQGIMLDKATLSCPAPSTSGQSINYLIQATYQDVDGGATVLPYYNPSNPLVAWSGPANAGTAQNTYRDGVCAVSVKAGVAATTGTQTTPSADSGYVGLWVVTVANGQTTITSGNISLASGAPFIANTLPNLAPLASPAFTDVPTAPTASLGNTSQQLANMAAVAAAITAQNAMPRYTTGQALPASNIGPIWHDDYQSVMTWQVFSANGAAYAGYASVLVGSLLADTQPTPRAGYVSSGAANLSRTTYAALRGWAMHNGIMVASGTWAAGAIAVCDNADGTTFKAFDVRGEFPRFWDDSRGADAGRVFGSWQVGTAFMGDGDGNNTPVASLNDATHRAVLGFDLDSAPANATPISMRFSEPSPGGTTSTVTGIHAVGGASAFFDFARVRARNTALLASIKF